MELHRGDTLVEYGIHGLEAAHTNGSEVARAGTSVRSGVRFWVARDLGCHARGLAWSPLELELLLPELVVLAVYARLVVDNVWLGLLEGSTCVSAQWSFV